MSAKFYTLLTEIGAAKLASAAALGVPLKITHMAVGDGGGVLPTPSAQQTALVAERRRAALNMLYIDPQNNSQIIAEQVIPETEGGWWIREVGLFDETGALIAVGNCPESYKPQLTEGSGRTQTVRMVLITSSTDNITLKIDPAVVLATRKYVDDKALELKVYVDDLMAKHLAAPDPHSQYAQKDSPTLTGIPKVPTPAAGNSTKQIANTEFVASSIAAMVDSAPAALDTLNELAAALGNDPNFATTMINALAGKQPLDNTLTNLSGKDIAGLLTYLGLGETAKQAAGAVQKTGDEISGKLTLPQTSSFGVNTNNTLGGSSIAIGDNDTGFKQNGDGILDTFANSQHTVRVAPGEMMVLGAIRAGKEKKLSLTSNNNSTMTATFNLWGDANRPTVIELDDDQGWHLYSQRNPDGSIVFTVNGDITANTLRAGGAIYQNNGDIFGSVWGNSWLSLWINNNFVADVQLGTGTSVTTWNNAGSWPNTPGYVVTSVWKDAQGENIDGINYAPLQKRVGNQWYTVQGGTA
ncbi:phage tail protein [Salmonella enterica]|uniref:phage tail protein n=1 Tax=Salmonella enterica TaxID=28901 RepID=UPI0009AAE6AC|nr:phage tail protein [Salmonella enterica]EBV7347648.1 phage tail protein [Salmonella enterica subsp. enterica serovar Oranienburg]EGM7981072.1 phage tail protein [Salmonella enterica subsp. enterica serovar Oranienburg]EIX7763433.1 phage tail protein [Salmonella enterica]